MSLEEGEGQTYDFDTPATKDSSVYQSKYHPCICYTLGKHTSTFLLLLAEYDKEKDAALIENTEEFEKLEARDPKFSKGQSKRIWNELYKVTCFSLIGSVIVVIHVKRLLKN